MRPQAGGFFYLVSITELGSSSLSRELPFSTSLLPAARYEPNSLSPCANATAPCPLSSWSCSEIVWVAEYFFVSLIPIQRGSDKKALQRKRWPQVGAGGLLSLRKATSLIFFPRHFTFPSLLEPLSSLFFLLSLELV